MNKLRLPRHGALRRAVVASIAALALVVAAELIVPVHGHFAPEAWFAFAAAFGFFTCVSMVLVARLIGLLLKRPDDYYGGNDDA
jgi:hypothetical protein